MSESRAGCQLHTPGEKRLAKRRTRVPDPVVLVHELEHRPAGLVRVVVGPSEDGVEDADEVLRREAIPVAQELDFVFPTAPLLWSPERAATGSTVTCDWLVPLGMRRVEQIGPQHGANGERRTSRQELFGAGRLKVPDREKALGRKGDAEFLQLVAILSIRRVRHTADDKCMVRQRRGLDKKRQKEERLTRGEPPHPSRRSRSTD